MSMHIARMAASPFIIGQSQSPALACWAVSGERGTLMLVRNTSCGFEGGALGLGGGRRGQGGDGQAERQRGCADRDEITGGHQTILYSELNARRGKSRRAMLGLTASGASGARSMRAVDGR
jgi:hypothetical protein